jgi:Ca2+-binding RTX toxin-like protein
VDSQRGPGDRPRALFVALAVLLAIALAAGAVVLARALRGGPGGRLMVGTSGPDLIVGQGGNDVIKGKGGRDRLRGGKGNDRLIGGRGRDVLVGGPGRDGFNMRNGVELPAPGRDVIRARDHTLDEINCGAGRDKAIVDRAEDGAFGCERLVSPRRVKK